MRTRRRFEILWESRLGSWAEDLGAIFARVPRTTGDGWSMRSFPDLKNRVPLAPGRGLLASLLVHAGAFALLAHASVAARVEPTVAAAAPDDAPIYLDLRALKELKILRALPVVRPGGSGGKPGIVARAAAAPRPAQDPPEASTATNPKFTVIVNPLKAESRTQAIHQSMAPPDLSIKVDQQLPDIVMADDPSAPKPQVDLQLHQPVAHDPLVDSQAAAAPVIPSSAPQLPIKIATSVPQPKMPTAYFASDSLHPVARAPLPDSKPAAAPTISSDAPQSPIKIAASVPQPKMPTAYFTPDSLHTPHDAGAATTRKNANADPSADGVGVGGIVVMSAQPAPFSQLVALAQGNRYGAIAIAPSKPGPGSPGGKPDSARAPAASGTGAGGDASVGLGAGNSGGGAGPATPQRASFSTVGGSGTSGGVDANGLLAPVLPAAVFPVTIAPKLRHAPLVISAGPMGGGGLDVYGALTCGRVYSIFLPMPAKNWALQYCAREAGGAPAATAPANAGVVQMQAGIVPPSPEQQFDFRRLPVPDKDGDKLIILQGMIGADGSVGSVRVFRGVLPEMDAEAAQAFGKWKFKPATRGGAAVALDVLVGVPARRPESVNAGAAGVEISR